MTSLMSSREMPLSAAIAAPIFCTSRGPRCLKTSAASSSPSDIKRIALLVMPSFAIGHPILDHGCNYLGVVACQLLGAFDMLLVIRGFQSRRFAVRIVAGGRPCLGKRFEHRFEHAQHYEQQHAGDQNVLA